jgi:hypothetical protein
MENKAVDLYRSYLKELAGKFIPSDLTSEMYRVFMMHILMGTRQAQRYFELLLEGSQKAIPMGDKIR